MSPMDPTIFNLFNLLKERAAPVPFREIRELCPGWSCNKIRCRCNQLVHQGFVERSKEDDTYQFKAIA